MYRKYFGKGEKFLVLSTVFRYLLLDCHVKAGTRFSPRMKRFFMITELEITRVDCRYTVTPRLTEISVWPNLNLNPHTSALGPTRPRRLSSENKRSYSIDSRTSTARTPLERFKYVRDSPS